MSFLLNLSNLFSLVGITWSPKRITTQFFSFEKKHVIVATNRGQLLVFLLNFRQKISLMKNYAFCDTSSDMNL